MCLSHEKTQRRDEHSRDTDAPNGMNWISVLKVSYGDSPPNTRNKKGSPKKLWKCFISASQSVRT